MRFWRKQRWEHSSLKKVLIQGQDQAGKGFSPKDVGGTDIIQESQLWAMGKGPKLPKNNMEKTLSWGNRHTQAV